MSKHRIKLLNGGFFDFVDMHESEYTIEELAHGLGRLCRFNGAIKKHYSVAQHSIYVMECAPKELALESIVHDLSESVMGDLSSPLKLLTKDFKKLEIKVEKYMFEKLGLKFPFPAEVKLSDVRVLAAEIRDLQPSASDWSAVAGIEPFEKKIVPWTAERATKEWLKKFYELTENK